MPPTLSGRTIQVDTRQLQTYFGTLNKARFDVVNDDDNQVYQVTADQLAGTGGPSEFYQFYVGINCDTIELPALAGVRVKAIFRGVPWELIDRSAPSPVDFQIKWDVLTDPTKLIISVNPSEFTAFQSGELITINYSLL